MRIVAILALIVAVVALFSFFIRREAEESTISFSPAMFQLTSSAFNHSGAIPPHYTCDGEDVSPPLEIRDAPEGTQSLVLIADDPDAPGAVWVHWLAYNIPPNTSVIGEGKEPEGSAGKNSWGRIGYGGPCPPRGVHRYFFKLFALDSMLSVPPGAFEGDIERAMQEHILGKAELIGLYERK